MKCKKCNEIRRKRINESKKLRVVDDYFMKWRWWLLILFLSVMSCRVFVFTQSVMFLEFGTFLRLSIATVWACTVLVLAVWSFPKCGGGLMSMSAMFFVVGSLTAYKEPLLFFAVSTMAISLIMLFLNIKIGIRFIIDVNVKELPWFVKGEKGE